MRPGNGNRGRLIGCCAATNRFPRNGFMSKKTRYAPVLRSIISIGRTATHLMNCRATASVAGSVEIAKRFSAGEIGISKFVSPTRDGRNSFVPHRGTRPRSYDVCPSAKALGYCQGERRQKKRSHERGIAVAHGGSVTLNSILASCSGAFPSLRRKGSQRGSEWILSNRFCATISLSPPSR